MSFSDATPEQIDAAMQQSHAAFIEYRKLSFSQRAAFMRAVARGVEENSVELITIAGKETNLSAVRLRTEKTRTVWQWNSYADACEKGDWLNCRIDVGDPLRVPPRPDLRKTMIPLGPVVVFGASNFPFAYSTAGGDTASAFAAGCTVVVKAHPGHPQTSSMMASIIRDAVKEMGLHEGTFLHLHGASFETGKQLVQHPFTKAVGFTGSVAGGRALFDWGIQREEPIPVFAEMGSLNPVFILPGKLNESPSELAKMLAASITLGLGQFCTKPGLIFVVGDGGFDEFRNKLIEQIGEAVPRKMLHKGIAEAFATKKHQALSQQGVVAPATTGMEEGSAVIAYVKADQFLKNPSLHEEVFGPFSLLVICSDIHQMSAIASELKGQLTTTVMATGADLEEHFQLADLLSQRCGRLILNGVPTGVEVVLGMQHGGPYPATTDSRFTAVGGDAIRRFARPICFQNWPNEKLPDELKNGNPLGYWRTVNNELTREPLH